MSTKKLSDDFIKTQKLYLLKEKVRLEQELKEMENFPQYGDSSDDNTEEVEDFTTSQGVEKNLLEMLSDVKKALSKIEKGEYGLCENCGGKVLIGEERLKAFPAATTCIKCDNTKK